MGNCYYNYFDDFFLSCFFDCIKLTIPINKNNIKEILNNDAMKYESLSIKIIHKLKVEI